MKIASWNVNSLRVRLSQVIDWLEQQQVDVLALQETKVTDDQFPIEPFRALGYQLSFAGQKTYNGVALLSRYDLAETRSEIPGLTDRGEQRVLAATVAGVRVLNLYVVNGQAVGSEKYRYKLHWLEQVRAFVAEELEQYPQYIMLGDFNIAPEDRDVYDPDLWRERVLCSTPEREALHKLLELGFVDTFRLFEQPADSYTWWDYRQAAFRRNRGLRIDLILASKPLSRSCVASWIDREPRGLDRPSDHAPVITEFDLLGKST